MNEVKRCFATIKAQVPEWFPQIPELTIPRLQDWNLPTLPQWNLTNPQEWNLPRPQNWTMPSLTEWQLPNLSELGRNGRDRIYSYMPNVNIPCWFYPSYVRGRVRAFVLRIWVVFITFLAVKEGDVQEEDIKHDAAPSTEELGEVYTEERTENQRKISTLAEVEEEEEEEEEGWREGLGERGGLARYPGVENLLAQSPLAELPVHRPSPLTAGIREVNKQDSEESDIPEVVEEQHLVGQVCEEKDELWKSLLAKYALDEETAKKKASLEEEEEVPEFVGTAEEIVERYAAKFESEEPADEIDADGREVSAEEFTAKVGKRLEEYLSRLEEDEEESPAADDLTTYEVKDIEEEVAETAQDFEETVDAEQADSASKENSHVFIVIEDDEAKCEKVDDSLVRDELDNKETEAVAFDVREEEEYISALNEPEVQRREHVDSQAKPSGVTVRLSGIVIEEEVEESSGADTESSTDAKKVQRVLERQGHDEDVTQQDSAEEILAHIIDENAQNDLEEKIVKETSVEKELGIDKVEETFAEKELVEDKVEEIFVEKELAEYEVEEKEPAEDEVEDMHKESINVDMCEGHSEDIVLMDSNELSKEEIQDSAGEELLKGTTSEEIHAVGDLTSESLEVSAELQDEHELKEMETSIEKPIEAHMTDVTKEIIPTDEEESIFAKEEIAGNEKVELCEEKIEVSTEATGDVNVEKGINEGEVADVSETRDSENVDLIGNVPISNDVTTVPLAQNLEQVDGDHFGLQLSKEISEPTEETVTEDSSNQQPDVIKDSNENKSGFWNWWQSGDKEKDASKDVRDQASADDKKDDKVTDSPKGRFWTRWTASDKETDVPKDEKSVSADEKVEDKTSDGTSGGFWSRWKTGDKDKDAGKVEECSEEAVAKEEGTKATEETTGRFWSKWVTGDKVTIDKEVHEEDSKATGYSSFWRRKDTSDKEKDDNKQMEETVKDDTAKVDTEDVERDDAEKLVSELQMEEKLEEIVKDDIAKVDTDDAEKLACELQMEETVEDDTTKVDTDDAEKYEAEKLVSELQMEEKIEETVKDDTAKVDTDDAEKPASELQMEEKMDETVEDVTVNVDTDDAEKLASELQMEEKMEETVEDVTVKVDTDDAEKDDAEKLASEWQMEEKIAETVKDDTEKDDTAKVDADAAEKDDAEKLASELQMEEKIAETVKDDTEKDDTAKVDTDAAEKDDAENLASELQSVKDGEITVDDFSSRQGEDVKDSSEVVEVFSETVNKTEEETTTEVSLNNVLSYEEGKQEMDEELISDSASKFLSANEVVIEKDDMQQEKLGDDSTGGILKKLRIDEEANDTEITEVKSELVAEESEITDDVKSFVKSDEIVDKEEDAHKVPEDVVSKPPVLGDDSSISFWDQWKASEKETPEDVAEVASEHTYEQEVKVPDDSISGTWQMEEKEKDIQERDQVVSEQADSSKVKYDDDANSFWDYWRADGKGKHTETTVDSTGDVCNQMESSDQEKIDQETAAVTDEPQVEAQTEALVDDVLSDNMRTWKSPRREFDESSDVKDIIPAEVSELSEGQPEDKDMPEAEPTLDVAWTKDEDMKDDIAFNVDDDIKSFGIADRTAAEIEAAFKEQFDSMEEEEEEVMEIEDQDILAGGELHMEEDLNGYYAEGEDAMEANHSIPSSPVMPVEEAEDYLEEVNDLLVRRASKRPEWLDEPEEMQGVVPDNPLLAKYLAMPASLTEEEEVELRAFLAENEGADDIDIAHFMGLPHGLTEQEEKEYTEAIEERERIRQQERQGLEKFMSMPPELTEQEKQELLEIEAEEQEHAEQPWEAGDAQLEDYMSMPSALTEEEKRLLEEGGLDEDVEFEDEEQYRQYIKEKFLQQLEDEAYCMAGEEGEYDYEDDYEEEYEYEEEEYDDEGEMEGEYVMVEDDAQGKEGTAAGASSMVDEGVNTESGSNATAEKKLGKKLFSFGKKNDKEETEPEGATSQPKKFFHFGGLGAKKKKETPKDDDDDSPPSKKRGGSGGSLSAHFCTITDRVRDHLVEHLSLKSLGNKSKIPVRIPGKTDITLSERVSKSFPLHKSKLPIAIKTVDILRELDNKLHIRSLGIRSSSGSSSDSKSQRSPDEKLSIEMIMSQHFAVKSASMKDTYSGAILTKTYPVVTEKLEVSQWDFTSEPVKDDIGDAHDLEIPEILVGEGDEDIDNEVASVFSQEIDVEDFPADTCPEGVQPLKGGGSPYQGEVDFWRQWRNEEQGSVTAVRDSASPWELRVEESSPSIYERKSSPSGAGGEEGNNEGRGDEVQDIERLKFVEIIGMMVDENVEVLSKDNTVVDEHKWDDNASKGLAYEDSKYRTNTSHIDGEGVESNESIRIPCSGINGIEDQENKAGEMTYGSKETNAEEEQFSEGDGLSYDQERVQESGGPLEEEKKNFV